MQLVDVNMRGLAQSVLQDSLATCPERKIETIVGDLPHARADRALLQQVLANLVENAVKYTRPRPIARVEIGARQEEAESIYYVRDNGVGFEMDYVHKLFKVFQRLHSDEQFEGTGIGLALVQRIIQRHGGRVWVEARIDEGATFYFTLPKPGESRE